MNTQFVCLSAFLTYCASACLLKDDIYPCSCEALESKNQTRNYFSIQCSSSHLVNVPNNLPVDTSHLDLSDNLLDPDRLSDLCIYPNLEEVNIAGNHITSLADDILSECEITRSIDLSRNVLNKVTKNTLNGLDSTKILQGIESREFVSRVFQNMRSLRILRLITHQKVVPPELFYSTRIQDLSMTITEAMEVHPTLFSPLKSNLSKLDISSNSLQRVHENIISDLKALKYFTFNVNLHTIPENLFNSLTLAESLVSIKLSGVAGMPRKLFSQLVSLIDLTIHGGEDMPSELFKGLLELKTLDLSSCKIKKFPSGWFSDLWSLEILNLTMAGLSETLPNDMIGLNSLKILDLSKNNLRHIPAGMFKSIADTIQEIDLSGNHLKSLRARVFGESSTLTSLSLSDNQIYFIGSEVFENLTSLRILNLSGNKLFQLADGIFKTNLRLHILDLSSNILIELPDKEFENTQDLSVFNMSDNRLENLPESIILHNIPSLDVLNLEYNPIQCSCETIVTFESYSGLTVSATCFGPFGIKTVQDFARKIVCALENDTTVIEAEEKEDYEYVSKKKTDYIVLVHPEESNLDAKEMDNIDNSTSGVIKSGVQNVSMPINQTGSDVYTVVSTGQPSFMETDGQETKSRSYYLAVAFITSVAVICVLIIVGLVCKKRRNALRYEVSNADVQIDVFLQENGITTAVAGGSEENNLKDVPSIQIETVDDDDNVKVVQYPVENNVERWSGE